MSEVAFTPLHIGGQDRASSTGATYEVRTPATQKLVSRVAAASAADCKEAVENAGKAFESWSKTTPGFKAAIFRKAAELIETPEFRDKIVRANVQESGLTEKWGAWIDFPVGKAAFQQAVDLPYKAVGHILPSDLGNHAFVFKRPMGVIFVMSPWNAPIGLTLMTTIAPLAAGNSVVLKTSEISPGCQLIAAEILKRAGLPDGVFNVIHVSREDAGPRVSEIIAHPLVRKIGFTGSDRVGRILAAEAAKHLKPCVFELGGKSPAVVLNDADVDVAARAIVSGALVNSGQSCISTERVIVQKEVAQSLIEKIKTTVAKIKAGEGADLGGLFTEASAENIIAMVKEAVNSGAELLVGDLQRNGTYVQPHIILGAKPGDRLWERETFGPVTTIAIVDSIDEAVELANASTYSLSASVWTTDVRKAIEVSKRIGSCRVLVNQSTVGSESGFHAGAFGGSSGYGTFDVNSFLDEQLISIPPADANPKFLLVDI